MTNKQIRRHSYKSYIHNVWGFLGVCVLAAMPLALNWAANVVVTPSLSHVIYLLIAIAGYPLSIGVIRYFYREFHGERSFVNEIFCYYKAKHLAGALLLGVFFAGIDFVSRQVNIIFQGLEAQNPMWFLWLIIIFLPMLYISYRLFLVPYVYINASTPLTAIRESIKKTRGYVFDIMVFNISIFFAPFLFLAVLTVAIFALFNDIQALFMARFIGVFLIPFQPYISLCLAGFAAELLRERIKTKKSLRNSHCKKRYRYKIDWFD